MWKWIRRHLLGQNEKSTRQILREHKEAIVDRQNAIDGVKMACRVKKLREALTEEAP